MPPRSSVYPASATPISSSVSRTRETNPSWEPSPKARTQEKKRKAAYDLLNDQLGKLVTDAVHTLRNSSSWEEFVHAYRGPSLLSEAVAHLPHPAATLLNDIRENGVPVNVAGEEWTKSKLEAAAARGPHKSAQEHAAFVREEMADFCRQGFWVVLPLDEVIDLELLRLSPLGVVPQRDRRPRLINDLTFSEVNADTIKTGPAEAMQFGRALQRILYQVRHANPEHGPVYASKLDVADGFYRLSVNARQALRLACLLPREHQEPQLVAIPLALPMGWVESPPYFCAATETVADLTNSRLNLRQVPHHRLEDAALTPTLPAATATTNSSAPASSAAPCQPTATDAAGRATMPPTRPTSVPVAHLPTNLPAAASIPFATPTVSALPILRSKRMIKRPLASVDIFVDDFLELAQGDEQRRRHITRVLLHTLDEVLQPADPTIPAQKEPASLKKLGKGDGVWETRKTMLGWILDTLRRTIELPLHRAQRLHDIFIELSSHNRVSTATWHKVIGELRSMALAVPGARGLFSALQTGFQQTEAHHRVRITAPIRHQLNDFAALAMELHTRPTRLEEIVEDDPSGLGAVDASGQGMGGVWFVPNARPMLWRARFPKSVQNALVTFTNPTGSINNSDLELAGLIAHQDVLAQHIRVEHLTFANLGDNVASLVWLRKGSVTTTKPPQHLLRLAALHHRHFRTLHTYDHIAGTANVMADQASRLWDLSDTELLAHFASHYPQEKPWKLCPLRNTMLSAVISCLQGKPASMPSVLNAPSRRRMPGILGWSFAPPSKSTRFSTMSKIRFPTSKYSVPGSGTAALPLAVNPSDFELWRTPGARLVRRWPAWGPRTTKMCPAVPSSCTASASNSRGMLETTTPPPASNPFHSRSSDAYGKPPPQTMSEPSETCASLGFSSFADRENMSRQPAIPTPNLSDLKMSNSWSVPGGGRPAKYHWRPWMPLGTQRFAIVPRKTAYKAKESPWGPPVILPSAPSKPCSAEFSTCEPTTPPSTPRSTLTSNLRCLRNVETSIASTSPVRSALPLPNCSPPSVSSQKISPPEVYAQAVLLPCFAPKSTVTSHNSSADGSPTRCSSISTSKPRHSWPTTRDKCSSTVNTLTTVPTISPIPTLFSNENPRQTYPPTTRNLNKLGKNGPFRGEPRSICDSICDWAHPARMCADRTIVNPVQVHSPSSTSFGTRFEEGATDVAACGNSRLSRDGEARPPPGRRGVKEYRTEDRTRLLNIITGLVSNC
jgi:hypothetical protein